MTNYAIGFFGGASNNTIYHNNFENNSLHVLFSGSCPNVWDNAYSGNYWSDYQTKYPNASLIDESGVGDTPYVIDAQNKDNYPLMEPFNGTLPIEASPTPSSPTGGDSEDNTTVDLTVLGVVVFVFIVVILVIAGLAVHYGRHRR